MTPLRFKVEQWDDLYEAAVFELSPTKLPGRIDLAQKAIQSRLKELDGKDRNAGEKRRLLDADRMLEMLLRIENTGSNQSSVSSGTF